MRKIWGTYVSFVTYCFAYFPTTFISAATFAICILFVCFVIIIASERNAHSDSTKIKQLLIQHRSRSSVFPLLLVRSSFRVCCRYLLRSSRRSGRKYLTGFFVRIQCDHWSHIATICLVVYGDEARDSTGIFKNSPQRTCVDLTHDRV